MFSPQFQRLLKMIGLGLLLGGIVSVFVVILTDLEVIKRQVQPVTVVKEVVATPTATPSATLSPTKAVLKSFPTFTPVPTK